MKEKSTEGVRLDKWLWAARFYKTRTLAREMIEGGKVHYNGQRTRPSKIIEPHAGGKRHYRSATTGKRGGTAVRRDGRKYRKARKTRAGA